MRRRNAISRERSIPVEVIAEDRFRNRVVLSAAEVRNRRWRRRVVEQRTR